MIKIPVYEPSPELSRFPLAPGVMRTLNFFRLKRWCKENMEPDQYVWLDVWENVVSKARADIAEVPYYIAFETEEDAIIFKLRYNPE